MSDCDFYTVLADYLSASICFLSSSNRRRPQRRPLLDLRNSVAIMEMLCQAASSRSRLLSRNTDPFPGWTLNRWSMSVRRSMEYLQPARAAEKAASECVCVCGTKCRVPAPPHPSGTPDSLQPAAAVQCCTGVSLSATAATMRAHKVCTTLGQKCCVQPFCTSPTSQIKHKHIF